jgi:hypothetical protein
MNGDDENKNMIDENEESVTHSVINRLFNSERTMNNAIWEEKDYELFRTEIAESIDQLARLNLDDLISLFMKINIEVINSLRKELICQVMLLSSDLKNSTIRRKRNPQQISEDIAKLILMVAEKKEMDTQFVTDNLFRPVPDDMRMVLNLMQKGIQDIMDQHYDELYAMKQLVKTLTLQNQSIISEMTDIKTVLGSYIETIKTNKIITSGISTIGLNDPKINDHLSTDVIIEDGKNTGNSENKEPGVASYSQVVTTIPNMVTSGKLHMTGGKNPSPSKTNNKTTPKEQTKPITNNKNLSNHNTYKQINFKQVNKNNFNTNQSNNNYSQKEILNFNSYDNNAPNYPLNKEEEFKVAGPRKNKLSKTTGTCNNDLIKPAPRLQRVFINHLHNETTIAVIKKFLSQIKVKSKNNEDLGKLKFSNVEEKILQHGRYRAFLFDIEANQRCVLKNMEQWPSGSSVKQSFFNKNNNYTNFNNNYDTRQRYAEENY